MPAATGLSATAARSESSAPVGSVTKLCADETDATSPSRHGVGRPATDAYG